MEPRLALNLTPSFPRLVGVAQTTTATPMCFLEA